MAHQHQTAAPSAFRRRTISYATSGLTTTRTLAADQPLPLIVEPAHADVDLARWASEHRVWLDERLLTHGGILFRGFRLRDQRDFEQAVRAISGEPLEYRERSSPRSQVTGHVYTSTDYPASQSIFPHNEASYCRAFPLKVFFFCQEPATTGGETPIGDTRRMLHRIDPAIVETFRHRRWMYVRNLGLGLGLPWQTVYQTDDPAAVERSCREGDITCEWRPNGALRTKQVRDALARHPRSGEWAWFNHLTFFHVSTLAPALRDGMMKGVPEEDLPNNTYYGDGAPIEPEVLDHLRKIYLDEMIEVPWQQGDLMMLDNMLVAHARRPFTGPRKVLFAMADPWSWADLRLQ